MYQFRRVRRTGVALLLAFVFLLAESLTAFAETKYDSWEAVAATMGEVLDSAVEIYEDGGDGAGKRATEEVNVAYYKFYEKLGFEKTVMAVISGSRGSEVEHQPPLQSRSQNAPLHPHCHQRAAAYLPVRCSCSPHSPGDSYGSPDSE